MRVSNYLSVEMLISLCITLFLDMLPLRGSSTSDREELIMNLKKQVTCSICLDTYTKPKILSCHHAFCCECLEEHARVSQRQGKFQCPECRKEIDLPEGNHVDCFLNSFFHEAVMTLIEETDPKGALLSNLIFCAKLNGTN